MIRLTFVQKFPLLHTALLLSGVALGVAGTLIVQSLGSKDSGAVVATPAVIEAPKRNEIEGAPQQATQEAHSIKLAQILAANDQEFEGEDLRRLGMDLANSNLKDALSLAETISSIKERLAFLRGVFEVWSANNPEEAAAYAMQNYKNGELRVDLVRAALGKWGAKDARAAYVWAEANLHGPMKEEAINSLVKNWAATKPEAAAEWFGQTGSISQSLMQSIASSWATQNPTAAATWVDSQANKTNRDNGRMAIARTLANSSPEQALAYMHPYMAGGGALAFTSPVTSTPPNLGKTKVEGQPATISTPTGEANTPNATVAANTPTTDPTPATAPVSDPTPDLATMLMNIWATQDPETAAANLTNFPEGKVREEAAATLATVWAASDIQSAVNWSRSITDPTLQSAVIQQLGTTWGAIEPDQAIAWLDTLPQNLSQNGYRGAYNSWASTDPLGLQDWILNQSGSPQIDLARRSLGDVNFASDPVTALELATGIQDAQMQADTISKYYSKWNKTDAASANDWLQAYWEALPPTTQAKLGSQIKKTK